MGLLATTVRDILLSASNYGVAYDQLRELAGFSAEEIGDSGRMVEWEKAANIWDLLADLTGNEQIGLILGTETNISITGMVGFLMQASNTFEEAVEVYCKYGYMVCPMVTFAYKRDGDRAIIELHQNAMWKSSLPRSARISIDFILANLIGFTKTLTGREIYPQTVEVEYTKEAVDEYRKLLKCQVLFNAPLHKIVYNAADMQTKVLTSDTSLFQMFSGILAQKKTLALQTCCRDTVKNLLVMQFKGQIPTVEEAAEGLGMTVRTLQRKLTEENTSFRTIANEVKKDLALHLMKNPDATVTEVAEVLGYGDLPAFRRAFKTWTNTTPKEVKRKLKAEQLPVSAAFA
ncbi:AraC family transcriptional regulator [Polluticoccus soli]|uniref:AraC family transcriptional regulator n=1 Tax=Polluticoccus soli TaxID=3034150 RepID=UPI0023E165B2|nr:AraC family transcriptional regulator [Flavipsychrobacter sp. JY13-12]